MNYAKKLLLLLSEIEVLKKENEILKNKNKELKKKLNISKKHGFKLSLKLQDVNNYLASLERKISSVK